MTVSLLKLTSPPIGLATKSTAVKERSPNQALNYVDMKVATPWLFAASGAMGVFAGMAKYDEAFEHSKLLKKRDQYIIPDRILKQEPATKRARYAKNFWGCLSLASAGIGVYSWWNSGGDKQFKNLFGMK
jgi:hypothetical protein